MVLKIVITGCPVYQLPYYIHKMNFSAFVIIIKSKGKDRTSGFIHGWTQPEWPKKEINREDLFKVRFSSRREEIEERRIIIIYNIFQLLVRTTTSKHKNTKYVVKGKVYTPPIPPRRVDVNSYSVTAPTSS